MTVKQAVKEWNVFKWSRIWFSGELL